MPRFVTGGQLIALVIALILSTAALIVPSITATMAEQSAWLAPWMGLPVALAVAYAAVELHRRYPDQTLIEYAPRILGKPLGKMVGFLYVWWFFHVTATILQEHSLFMDSTILIATPGSVFYGSLALLGVYLLGQGLHVLVYLNVLMLPFMLALLMTALILVSPNMDPGNLVPLISHGGLPQLLVASLGSAGWLAQVVLVSMFLPYVRPDAGATRAITAGLVITVFTLSLVTAGTIAVFNASETVRLQFPVYSLTRFVFISEFFNRLDALAVVVWVAAVTVKFGLWFFAAVLALAQLTGLRSPVGLLPAAALFVVALSTVLYDNVAQMTTFLAEVMPLYSLVVFEVGLPALLLVIALFQKKGVKG
ncbi:MAG: endospore germination permease [Clostridia bacterium]|nr:endospore germination permease [Clostridia bacterium]MDQ7791302.1 endospore germination permease [Clostridia bacterium]